jgi:hypothetical protein
MDIYYVENTSVSFEVTCGWGGGVQRTHLGEKSGQNFFIEHPFHALLIESIHKCNYDYELHMLHRKKHLSHYCE